VITNLVDASSKAGHLRPLDIRRDLVQVADLVEHCFADTLDADGKRYIQQMRMAGQRSSALGVATRLAARSGLPLMGFVWEEDDRLVGNLTLIPYLVRKKRFYLIANVAVHPEYRRKGIAYRLTTRALEYAQRNGIQEAWLHVREENAHAVRLYRSLGFTERARRTTWMSEARSGVTGINNLGNVDIKPRRRDDWTKQKGWLKRLYPEEVTWHLSLKITALRPGLFGSAYRFLNDLNVRQWSARQGKRLLGVLAWHASRSHADYLWLAANQEDEDAAARLLLGSLYKNIHYNRPLSLDYPAGRATQAIQDAGFKVHQTLIWMSIDTSPIKL